MLHRGKKTFWLCKADEVPMDFFWQLFPYGIKKKPRGRKKLITVKFCENLRHSMLSYTGIIISSGHQTQSNTRVGTESVREAETDTDKSVSRISVNIKVVNNIVTFLHFGSCSIGGLVVERLCFTVGQSLKSWNSVASSVTCMPHHQEYFNWVKIKCCKQNVRKHDKYWAKETILICKNSKSALFCNKSGKFM